MITSEGIEQAATCPICQSDMDISLQRIDETTSMADE